jgi:hypothetical protein
VKKNLCGNQRDCAGSVSLQKTHMIMCCQVWLEVMLQQGILSRAHAFPPQFSMTSLSSSYSDPVSKIVLSQATIIIRKKKTRPASPSWWCCQGNIYVMHCPTLQQWLATWEVPVLLTESLHV